MKKYLEQDLNMNNTYVITGCLRNGNRFKPITTITPQHYNIFKGTIWLIKDGKRKLVKSIVN